MDPKIAAALANLTAAIEATSPGPGTPFADQAPAPAPADPTPAPPPVTGWHRPTAVEDIAFAVAYGVNVEEMTGRSTTTGNDKTKIAALPGVPATVGSQPDPEAARGYFAHGYRPDGTHYVWTAEWLEKQRRFCDRIAAANDFSEAGRLCKGADGPGIEPDAVIAAAMAGLIAVSEDFIGSEYAVPKIGVRTTDNRGFAINPALGRLGGVAQTLGDVALYLALPAVGLPGGSR